MALIPFLSLQPTAWQTPTNSPAKVAYVQLIQPVSEPRFPDRTQQALEAEAYNAIQARLAAEAAAAAELATEQAEASYTASTQVESGTLTGSLGSSTPYGNCVDMARRYGKLQPGDPISWSVATTHPFIGAAALFYYNHVAIVTGIWSNGDIEVVQENYRGGQHRFSPSEIRGYF